MQSHHGWRPEQAAWQHCFPACVLLLIMVHLKHGTHEEIALLVCKGE